jgi:hypothetical protein
LCRIQLKKDGRWIPFTRTFRRLLIDSPSAVTGGDVCSMFRRNNSKDKCQGDIGCPTGESSWTIVFHLFCQQNIGDFRLRPCAVVWYADDMKVFLPVHGFQDCMKIQ